MPDKKLEFKIDYSNLNVCEAYNADKPLYPLVLSIPHSGRYFPPEFLKNVRFEEKNLRRNEDLLVDELLKGAVEAGLPALKMNVSRVFVDLNRDRLELDPSMFFNYPADKDAMFDRHCRMGIGVIHRINYLRENLYDGKLDYNEVQERLRRVYDVYHDELRKIADRCVKKFGFCLVLDCHSMPSKICSIIDERSGIDICLGNLFGQSCPPEMTEYLAARFWDRNYNVEENCPYSGAYITFEYCQPRRKMYTLQLEINRGLYADEEKLEKNLNFAEISEDICYAAVDFANWLRRR